LLAAEETEETEVEERISAEFIFTSVSDFCPVSEAQT
jgi:hypothetical protein